jgi:hypothetical protein
MVLFGVIDTFLTECAEILDHHRLLHRALYDIRPDLYDQDEPLQMTSLFSI